MTNKPESATHYSPSRDEYYHFDNACFVWSDELDQWLELSIVLRIEDLVEV